MSDAPARAEAASDANASAGSAAAASGSIRARADSFVLAGVVTCFFLSGLAALLYQTAWLRQFSLVFGTSELAVAAVLAAYMGGLAAGAAVSARFVPRVRRPVLVYGLLEGGIAASALAVPLLMAGAGASYVWLLGDLPEPPDAATLGQPLFYLIVAFLVLALPTGFMGATLPLLARYAVQSDRQVGPRVALLYAANTAGAVLGTLFAAFVLLPELGLRATVWVGVAVNAAVFALAAVLTRWTGEAAPVGQRGAAAAPPGFFSVCVKPLFARTRSASSRLREAFLCQPAWILPLMLISGANALFYEVLWTRMLSHVLGGSVYAFATMLAAFLSGIALGGGLAGMAAVNRQRAAAAFVVTQGAIAVLSAAVYAWMQTLIPDARTMQQSAIYAVLVMLPATVFIGATFPLAVRVLAPGERQAGSATAMVYAWNTVGAIVGAIAAGFLLIPLLGFEGAIELAVLVNLLIALWTVVCILPFRTSSTGLAALAVLASLVFYEPVRPEAVISRSAFTVPDSETAEEIYFAVGRSATVLLRERDGKLDLRTNGLPEASILIAGTPPLGQLQPWLSGLPLAARPDARTMLMIGFGGGVALEGVPASVRAIDVIELEPEVINANRRLAGRRAQDPLEDQRVNIVINDARNALRLTQKRYDVIVSQPSHPWTAGASHLFTREFVGQAKNHLNDNGVFVQWMSAGFVDDMLLRSLAATLLDAYENVRLYHAGAATLLFLASDGNLDLELQLRRIGRPLTDNVLYYSFMGLNGIEDFVAALLLDKSGIERFAAGAELATDDRNLMATHSRTLSDGLELEELLDLLAPYDPLLDGESWIYGQFGAELDFVYIAGRLLSDGQIDRVAELASAVRDASTRELIAGLVRGSRGELDGAREAFLSALRENPGNAAARFALVEPELAALATGRAGDEISQLAAGLPAAAAAVIDGWRLAVANDYQGLANLDRALARTNVTDLWFPDATRLRADWRTQVVGETRHALDAVRMLDRALLIKPDIELFVLRAAAAEILGDNDAFIETTRYAVENIASRLEKIEQGSAPTSAAELDVMFRRLVALRVKLTQLPSDSRERAAPLADEIGRVQQRAQVLAR